MVFIFYWILHFSISDDDFVTHEIYDKRDDVDLDIFYLPCLDGDAPPSSSYGIYILLDFAFFYIR